MKILLLALLLAAPAGAAELSLTLKSAEESALAVSNQYRAAELSAGAAEASAAAAGALLHPRFTLEGSLRYAHVVPEIAMPAALGGAKPLGDNWNYSVGPAAYWTFFDGGALRSGRDAARRTAAARRAEAEHVRRQTVLKARNAYFQLQLALERVYLIGENLQLSLAQLKDIALGAKAGTRSRLDEIRARQETLARRRDLVRARADLGAALREFAFLTGLEPPPGTALPSDARLAGRDLGGAQEADLFLRAEAYTEILGRLLPAAGAGPAKNLPSVEALDYAARAYSALSGGYKAERLPRLTLGARSSLDYPNGPNLYSFLQNSASLSLSLPLFEGGRSSEKRREQELNAAAASERRTEAALAAEKDFRKALDAYAALLAEQEINIEAVDDAVEAARLAYEAYKAGGGTWLEVESANLKSLQAKTTTANANSEILIKLALLDSLTGSVK
ncbi:MAG: TolC family protein [Elusimicrobiales bacterium]|nr:TolC family protein [Elusimicrobiales bacterium]